MVDKLQDGLQKKDKQIADLQKQLLMLVKQQDKEVAADGLNKAAPVPGSSSTTTDNDTVVDLTASTPKKQRAVNKKSASRTKTSLPPTGTTTTTLSAGSTPKRVTRSMASQNRRG
jgi:hypothetical protein